MDLGAIATFKAYYLRRTFRKLIPKTDGESSIKLWKNYIIRYAVDNISESWKELQSTIPNHVWKTIWPEYIKTNEPEDLEEGDLVDLIDADREPLSRDDLIQLETETALDEESDLESAICHRLTKKLAECAFLVQTGNKFKIVPM
ncbi:hypothetical protein QE152_g142 [Popillia japonica]|uniref:DDE-1 domain-containing protein n=1 Tax=Popillia japonica TaxID=7064 RepID=A0AAW1NL09_POPJA